MRPILKPGLSRVWPHPHILRLGHGSRRRQYELDAPLRELLDALDGTRDTDGLVDYGLRLGVTGERTIALLVRLALDGALDDAALPTPGLVKLTAAERVRLAPIVSALGLRNRLPGSGARALERRSQRQTAVYGLGLIGAQVARHLAASGVGVVRPLDQAKVGHTDIGPGAFDPAEVGVRRQDAVARAIQRQTPEARVAPSFISRKPDLAILAPAERHPMELTEGLLAGGVPHLYVRLLEDEAVVGPLVVPDQTACVQCAELTRAGLDPAWPRFLAQLGTPRLGEVAPCDPALALLAVAFTVQHALSFLDGGRPPVIGGVLKLSPPDGPPVREELDPHPDCPCGAAAFDSALDGLDNAGENTGK